MRISCPGWARVRGRHLPWGRIGAVVAMFAVGVAVTACSAGESTDTGDDTNTSAHASVDLTHVHGLGVNPADGRLYVGTHDGLYQILPDGQASLVGTGRQDLMGFTVVGPDSFLASGHPGPGEDSPDHLGLIESSDGGVTWTSRSLAGEADFQHRLQQPLIRLSPGP